MDDTRKNGQGHGRSNGFSSRVKKVLILMDHVAKDGSPKLVKQCSLALTGKAVVNMIITNMGVFEINNGLRVLELAPGINKEEIIKN